MTCAYHMRETILGDGIVTTVKKYDPPLGRSVFKGLLKVTWFNKIELDCMDGVHRTLYDFEVTGKPNTRTQKDATVNKGDRVSFEYFPLAKRKRGCLKWVSH